ncbi:hypothetical protein F5972_03590 [Microbispora cellulosiformans]|uniref:5'-Nucleotidase C-terminal domain-containing protein n=1 Tax=Microbispora cellulosiformans TaxID=2614688 RepID=A0A5J5KDJ4_9ACTN|nr:5'-nucleotidase [Microbispora cellulosiformans]KAA9381908.1 hypothetical protein F5972_03590 [Microbispora cellulosiformans]
MRKLTLSFERTTATKCPVTFNVYGTFEGLPPGLQLIQYRVVGTEQWKNLKSPTRHNGSFTALLATIDWEWDYETDPSGHTSVQIELRQPDGLMSDKLYYFECGMPGADETFGETSEPIVRTPSGGPLAELVADANLAAVQARSGAEAALVSRYGFHLDLDAGPVTYEEVFATLPAGFAVDVWEVTGAALKSVLAYPNAQGWVLTPSSSLRYTLEGGAVTEMTLNGVPVADDQVIRVAANYVLVGGYEGFPRWPGVTSVYRGGPDDRGALATYLVKNSPVSAPAGDRVTIR